MRTAGSSLSRCAPFHASLTHLTREAVDQSDRDPDFLTLRLSTSTHLTLRLLTHQRPPPPHLVPLMGT
jgi:hypothetical protein